MYQRQSRERIFLHDAIDNKNESANFNEFPKCQQQNRLAECKELTSLKTDDRWKSVRERKLCLSCSKNHFLRRCNSKKQCNNVDGCEMPRNPLLHNRREQNVPVLSYTGAKERILFGLDNANKENDIGNKEKGIDGLIAAKCRIG